MSGFPRDSGFSVHQTLIDLLDFDGAATCSLGTLVVRDLWRGEPRATAGFDASAVVGHIAGARHCPIGALQERLDEVALWSSGSPIWVHCAAGSRASIAASLLDRRGVPVVLVDDAWDNSDPRLLTSLTQPGGPR